MDEVGRGTTVKDGLAIAFASVHHLVTKNQSSCLFATHFHELSDMIGCTPSWKGKGVFKNVRFYCTDVNEIDVRLSLSFLAFLTPPPRIPTSPMRIDCNQVSIEIVTG